MDVFIDFQCSDFFLQTPTYIPEDGMTGMEGHRGDMRDMGETRVTWVPLGRYHGTP